MVHANAAHAQRGGTVQILDIRIYMYVYVQHGKTVFSVPWHFRQHLSPELSSLSRVLQCISCLNSLVPNLLMRYILKKRIVSTVPVWVEDVKDVIDVCSLHDLIFFFFQEEQMLAPFGVW